jgi:predicted ArsR family transcriptional regulator
MNMESNIPMRCRLLEALEREPMAVDHLADHLNTAPATVRARLAEYRGLGVVRVVGKKPRGRYAVNVWAIAQEAA